MLFSKRLLHISLRKTGLYVSVWYRRSHWPFLPDLSNILITFLCSFYVVVFTLSGPLIHSSPWCMAPYLIHFLPNRMSCFHINLGFRQLIETLLQASIKQGWWLIPEKTWFILSGLVWEWYITNLQLINSGLDRIVFRKYTSRACILNPRLWLRSKIEDLNLLLDVLSLSEIQSNLVYNQK